MNSKPTFSFISELDTIITLGGSPMAVAVPPMLENKTSAIKMFLGSKFNTSHNLEGYLFSNDNVYSLYLLTDYFLKPKVGLPTWCLIKTNVNFSSVVFKIFYEYMYLFVT